MTPNLTSRSEFTLEMLEKTISEMKPVQDIPVTYNDEFFGNMNALTGSIELSNNGQEIFKHLVHETHTNIYCQDTLGNTYKGSFYKEIKNIRRIRKGKRYIIKFDYTNDLCFKGTKVENNLCE